MAGIAKDKTKNSWKVFYVKPSTGKRSSICIGNITGPKRLGKRPCEKIVRIMSQLEESQSWGVDPDSRIMEEIAGLSQKVIAKIENTGLLPRMIYVEIGEIQKEWADSLKGEVNERSIKGYLNNTVHLVE